MQILYDLGHHAALASLAYVFGLIAVRLPAPRRIWAIALLAVLAIAVGSHSLAPDLVGLGERIAGRQIRAIPYVLAAVAALGVPFAAVLGRMLALRKLRLVALVIALLLVGCNFRYLRGGHAGIHTFLALFAAAIMSAALVGLELPARWFNMVTRARLSVPMLAIAGTLAIWRAPDAEVQIALARVDTALLSPVSDLIWKRAALPRVTVPDDLVTWFEPRLPGRTIGPSNSSPIAPNPVVVLVTVDAFRADLLRDDRYSERFPQMTALRNASVFFPQARSTAADTRTSLAAIFTGKLFSRLPWTKLYSSIETYEGPYFPAILTGNGVRTINFAVDYEIASKKRGVVRGFSEERIMLPASGANLVVAQEAVGAMVACLRESPERAMFFYTHLSDPHAPYDLGGKGTDDHDSYLREVETVDKALGALRRALEAPPFANRSVLILSADHGEFFGEHGYYDHAHTVYEEVVRVPLMIKSSGAAPRRVSEPVSLLDLGPTILDLFGLAWPSDFMGETLRPALTGLSGPKNRPIPLQSRVNYGLVFPDGFKATVNWSRNWEEVYDLTKDPEERLNLRDRDTVLSAQRMALLKHYFNIHTGLRADGATF
ncbi:MAG TPA: sulfatase-like hydrolase/transferase [Polyangiaceae bacterium]|nr:sulfatase-like hydrolase/transferase [Polyangiaceae bacterium]